MRINAQTCVGCGQCRPFCIMQAIGFARSEKGDKVHCVVEEDECVDCGICQRSKACPTDSLFQPVHEYPRSIRGVFSNPLAVHKETSVPGRGTEEMKTNDITNRYKRGFAGMAAEMGRPGTGARLRDAEKVFMALAKLGVEFEPENPLTGLLADPKTGKMRDEVLNEKVLSAIIEIIVPQSRIPEVIQTMEQVAGEIGTIFTVDLVARCDEDLTAPAVEAAAKYGWWRAPGGKTNLGLGKMDVKGAKA